MSPIKNGDTVRVNYKGYFDNNEVFDSTEQHGENAEPLEFTVGKNQVISGFENAVIGKELNDEITIHIEPKDGIFRWIFNDSSHLALMAAYSQDFAQRIYFTEVLSGCLVCNNNSLRPCKR